MARSGPHRRGDRRVRVPADEDVAQVEHHGVDGAGLEVVGLRGTGHGGTVASAPDIVPEIARSGRKVARRPPPGQPAACTFLACGMCSPARSSRPPCCWSPAVCRSCATPSTSCGRCARSGCRPRRRSCAGSPRPRWRSAWPRVVVPSRLTAALLALVYAGFTAFVVAGAAPRRRAVELRLLRPAGHPADPGARPRAHRGISPPAPARSRSTRPAPGGAGRPAAPTALLARVRRPAALVGFLAWQVIAVLPTAQPSPPSAAVPRGV